MSKLQRLVLNHKDGTSEFIIRDENAPAFDEAQNKTDEEKAQARENIDAVSQQDFEQRNDDIYFDISYCVSAAESQTFTDDQKALARANIGAAAVGEAGGINPLYITLDTDTETASEPAQRIQDYVRNGGDVFLRSDNTEIAFSHADGYGCYFTENNAEERAVRQWVVHDDGSYEVFGYNAAEFEFVATKITAPSTAKVGQTIVVKSVDLNGRPSAWEAVDLPSGSGCNCPPIMLVKLQYVNEYYANAFDYDNPDMPVCSYRANGYKADKTRAEIRNAVDSGTLVFATVSGNGEIHQHPDIALDTDEMGNELLLIGDLKPMTLLNVVGQSNYDRYEFETDITNDPYMWVGEVRQDL